MQIFNLILAVKLIVDIVDLLTVFWMSFLEVEVCYKIRSVLFNLFIVVFSNIMSLTLKNKTN